MKIRIQSVVIVVVIIMIQKINAQENVLIGLNYPAYGVKIKANFPSYSGVGQEVFQYLMKTIQEIFLNLEQKVV